MIQFGGFKAIKISNPEALKIKIILLDDSGVGKTTFRRRLETNSFDDDILATI